MKTSDDAQAIDPQGNDADVAEALLLDLARAEHDILSFAKAHALSLDELVAWATEAKTRRTLAGLCVLADTQTQLLLSRYRLIAATRLIGQATAEDDTLSPEQVRKACVDLLKTELTRAADMGTAEPVDDDEAFNALARAMSIAEPERDASAPTQQDP
jgi:hypothetical protein